MMTLVTQRLTQLSALVLALSASAGAVPTSLPLPPPSFPIAGPNGTAPASFVNFLQARHRIVYDLRSKTAQVQSRILFQTDRPGLPIFDLVPEPTDVRLDGKAVQQTLVNDPHGATQLRAVLQPTSVGKHVLEMNHTLTEAVAFDVEDGPAGVRSAFFMSDLKERKYLEQYLPSNLVYDQYAISLTVEIAGLKGEQEFFTNGLVKKTGPAAWQIEFPPYYNATMPYFHTAPKGAFKVRRFQHTTPKGRTFPVTIYSKTPLEQVGTASAIPGILNELEQDYGPWRHHTLVAYFADNGMEYAGAMVTTNDVRTVGHELMHSYFACGLMQADGNSGWIDEAIAVFRDRGYQSAHTPNFWSSAMANHSPWARMTDRDAYGKGANFIEFLNHLFAEKGGMKPLLQLLLKERLFRPITTPEFQAYAEKFYGASLKKEFTLGVYGQSPTGRSRPSAPNPGNAIHRPWTPEMIRRHL